MANIVETRILCKQPLLVQETPSTMKVATGKFIANKQDLHDGEILKRDKKTLPTCSIKIRPEEKNMCSVVLKGTQGHHRHREDRQVCSYPSGTHHTI